MIVREIGGVATQHSGSHGNIWSRFRYQIKETTHYAVVRVLFSRIYPTICD